MFFANLGLGQFLALAGIVSAVSVALYLLDRSRRRVVVSTLRFWIAAEQPTAVMRRKRIQQPLSLFLQLLSMLLLLLAIAQLRFGGQGGQPRHHVLILETSAWMNAQTTGRRTLMDLARERANAYIHALPAGDMVLLVRADALATPATAWEANRRKLEMAIANSEPSSTALNLDQALEFARKVQGRSSQQGEVAFVGSGRIAAEKTASTIPVSGGSLRVLPIVDKIENVGFRKIGMKRSPSDPYVWDIFVLAKNYGKRSREVTVDLAFANMPAGTQRFVLPAGGEHEAAFTYRTKAGGVLQARLTPGDSFPEDNRASLQLPPLETLEVTVYSSQPELLKPFLLSNPQVAATFRSPAEYTSKDKGLVILDRFRPTTRPEADSVWIDPPSTGSPIPIRMRATGSQTVHWITGGTLDGGLRSKDIHLQAPSVFNTAEGDLKVAEVDAGPVIVARPGSPSKKEAKMVVFGFHPALSAMRYELATPLLFANVLRWVAPDTFRSKEFSTQVVGTVNVALETEVAPSSLRVVHEDGSPIPFTLEGKSLHFFSGTPGVARVILGDRESVYSLSLPDIGDTKWQAPEGVANGLPRLGERLRSSHDLWQILALLAGLGLAVEWLLFGRFNKLLGHARNVFHLPSVWRKAS